MSPFPFLEQPKNGRCPQFCPLNAYIYVANNPILVGDPLGLLVDIGAGAGRLGARKDDDGDDRCERARLARLKCTVPCNQVLKRVLKNRFITQPICAVLCDFIVPKPACFRP